MSSALTRLLLVAVALVASGCLKQILINGQIEGTRQASAAFDVIDDFDLAESAAASGLVQFEGMHQLAPDNTDALFMLAKGYTGYAYGFIEDRMERAEDEGDRRNADYHRRRAINAYGRAVHYGLDLLAHAAPGFEAVQGDETALRNWLNTNFTKLDDAGNLFWTGYAWVGRTNLMKDDAEAVSQLYVGVTMLERSVAIDPSYSNYSGMVVLGAYHARSAMAELDEAKTLLEGVMKSTDNDYLLAQFNYAAKYACARADYPLYDSLLRQVLDAETKDPARRLINMVAKRRALRWIGESRMFDECGMEPGAPAPAATDAAPAPAPAG